MNASSSPPPGGPARTVFEIGTPIDVTASSDALTGRGRLIAWGAFGILVVLAIALANLSGLTGDGPPKNDSGTQLPGLSWNAPVAQPVATADAADTAGQNLDQDDPPAKTPAAKAPVVKPKSTSAPEPAAKPKPATAPKPTATPDDQGLVLPGTRCQNKHHRGHTADGGDARCTRKHRNDDLHWQAPRTNRETGWSRPGWGATGYNNRQWSSSNQSNQSDQNNQNRRTTNYRNEGPTALQHQ